MTAKPRKPASPADTNPSGQPGSLIDSIQSEVSAEASPMLTFLANNARIIAAALVLFIAGIIGYWVYEDFSAKGRDSDIAALGKILLISDTKTRLAQLEDYAAGAPGATKRQAWFSIMEAASELKDYPRVYKAWDTIRGFDDSLRVTATVGMADALTAQGKYKAALETLEGVTAGIKDGAAPPVYTRILSLAEYLGEYGRALTACDAFLAKSANPADVALWTQKKALLERKMAENKTSAQ